MNYFHFKDNWLGVWPGSREFNLYLEMIHLPTSSFFIHSIIISGLTHFLSQLFMEIWILLKLNFVIDKCMENFSVHMFDVFRNYHTFILYFAMCCTWQLSETKVSLLFFLSIMGWNYFAILFLSFWKKSIFKEGFCI